MQQLRECCNSTNSMKGCGNVPNAFDYICDNGGLVPDVVYRFHPEIGLLYKKIEVDAVTVDGCYHNDNATEELLRKFVAYRPVCATICADSNFELSSDKILRGVQYDLDKAEKLGLTHDILVIGYGILDGIPVWIIKNSWGEEWGDFGFRYIIRNEGAFGIGKEISFPMKYTRNRKCKVRSEFDIGFGKHWYFVAKDWPRYNVDVGDMVDQTMDMDRMP